MLYPLSYEAASLASLNRRRALRAAYRGVAPAPHGEASIRRTPPGRRPGNWHGAPSWPALIGEDGASRTPTA